MTRIERVLRAMLATAGLAAAAAAPAETEIRADAEVFASPLAQAVVPDVQSVAAGPLPATDVAVALDAADSGYTVNATAAVDLLAAELRVYLSASSDAPNPEWTGPPGTFGPDPVAQASAIIDEYLTFSGPPGTNFTIDLTMDFDEAGDTITTLGVETAVALDGGLRAFEGGPGGVPLDDGNIFVSTVLFESGGDIADLTYTSRTLALDGSGQLRVLLTPRLIAFIDKLDAGPASATLDFSATATVRVAVNDPAVSFASDSGQFLDEFAAPDPAQVPALPPFLLMALAALLAATATHLAARRA